MVSIRRFQKFVVSFFNQPAIVDGFVKIESRLTAAPRTVIA